MRVTIEFRLTYYRLVEHLTNRAERRMGEILAEMEMHPGGRPGENPLHRASSLSEFGIEHTQCHRWQLMAEVSDADFENFVAESVG
jgi:hypothetical protein